MKNIYINLLFIFIFLFSNAQDLDLNKAGVKLQNKEDKIDTIVRLREVKVNYSYFSGLDFFIPYYYSPNYNFIPNYYSMNHVGLIDAKKSGVFSISFHQKVNKWKFGIGINYSNYKFSESKISSNYYMNYSFGDYSYTTLTTTINVISPILMFERFLNKNLYLGLHLGWNFINIRQEEKDLDYLYSNYRVYPPYTKFCLGYQFKLSNRLNFNLELGVGGGMTNTGVSYLVK